MLVIVWLTRSTCVAVPLRVVFITEVLLCSLERHVILACYKDRIRRYLVPSRKRDVSSICIVCCMYRVSPFYKVLKGEEMCRVHCAVAIRVVVHTGHLPSDL